MNLSIIIPTLNEERNIGNVLSDISKQDFSKNNIEVIVADAESTDNTRNIVEQYGAKIVNGGIPSIARNNGSKEARGDILYFMDSDIRINNDFLTKSYIEFISRILDVAGMDNHPIYDENYKSRHKMIINSINWLANKLIFRASEYTDKPKAIGTCMLFNKKSFMDSGGFDETIYWGEDTEMAQRMYNNNYNFGILKQSSIYTRPRKIMEHGIWNYYINVIKLNNYRDNHGEITSKEKFRNITGLPDYFRLENN
jgi:glycosyltransferase involved in cell wall biosynthesis